ncbi:MAG: PilZ domain-containing protein [Bacteriovoracaceae bacterium]|nr:PilZ domain-containing protein [Bacteriovoracaceae bacterium]
MKCQYNYWQAEGRKSFRRLLGRWEIELLGPSLYTGSWVKRSTLSTKRTEYEWLYYNKEHELFAGQEGKWIFAGDRPQLNSDKWKFTGTAPELYYQDGDKREYKILTKEQGAVLEVANEVENRELKSRIYNTYRVQYNSDYETPKEPEKESFLDLTEQYSEDLFEMVSDKKKIGQYLLEAQNEERNILVWTPHRQHKISAKIKYNTSTVEFELKESNPAIEQSINFANHKYLYSKIDLPKGLVFVPIKTPKVRDGRISVSKPELVWKVQRRKWHRLNLEKSNVLSQVSNEDENQTAQLCDISAGGARIKLKQGDHLVNEIKQIKFKLNDKEIVSDVEVCWLDTQGEQPTVGLRYVNLSADASRHINLYVLEKSKNYFDKYGEN